MTGILHTTTIYFLHCPLNERSIDFPYFPTQKHYKVSLAVCSDMGGKKEGNVLFNDALNILFMVIGCQTYGKGPFR